MKTLGEVKRILQAQKSYLHQRYGVQEIGVFGSYVELPGIKVDVAIKSSLRKRVGQRILNEVVAV